MRPFHDVSTLSSRSGAILDALCSISFALASRKRYSRASTSIPADRAKSGRGVGTCRMLCPSKLPWIVTPWKSLKSVPSSSPMTSTISSGLQTKNFPSAPSLSASCAE